MSHNRIDFYLLETENHQDNWLFTCRLIEKAYLKGHRIFIFCADQADAEMLDELLWGFKEESFIPHNLQGEGPEPPPPVQIGYDAEPRGFNDLLINMSQTVPTFYQKFKRIIEVVPNEEAAKELSRARYRDYRARGASLHIHNLASETTE